MARTVHRMCLLCEAHCGISVEVEGDRVLRITGDPLDPMSHGYICPKGVALADLYSDPDRLRRPVKRVDGRFVEIGWDEGLALAADGLRRAQKRHGRDTVATYFGNPSVHGSAALAAVVLRKLLGSRNNYSSTSLDQLPQYRVAHEMLGHLALLPVPDVDRTDHMLVLGANPAVSNGSIMTAPGIRRRLQAIRERGGTIVVVDPRRTETARLASEHVSIEPGGDVYLLLAMLNTLFAGGNVRLGRLAEHCDGLDDLAALASDWPPERAAPLCGVDPDIISRLAREFAGARRAVAYGRVGTCQQETGTLTHWLIQVLNIVTSNFDESGGAMFATPAVDLIRLLKLLQRNRPWGAQRQRVSGLPGFSDELPAAGLADEILTPGRDRSGPC